MNSDQNTAPFPPLSDVPPLTSKAIEAARRRAKDYELGDGGAPGLRLRVTPTGKKVFRWYVSVGGVQRKITIGPWSKEPRPACVTLADARKWLERLKAAHRAGRLDEVLRELATTRPTPAKERPAPRIDDGALTVRQLATDFLAYVDRRRKRPEQVRRPIELDILPAIGDRPVTSITPMDCRQIVERVVARGSRTQAGIVLGVQKQLFNFAWGRGDIAGNPTAPLRDAGALGIEKNISQRCLTPDEIAAFWKALDAYRGMTPTVRASLKIILLTGVRSGELIQAEWSEVDFDAATWTVPVAHQKLTRKQEQTARPWTVPLAPTALELFRELDALAKSLRSRYVCASFNGEGAALTDKALNHAMRRLFTGAEPFLAFPGERPTPHDLRRTMRTHLGDTLSVPFHVAERCLNHSLGKIAATYDVGDYLADRRAALEKWDAYVRQVISNRDLLEHLR